jgi:hypothetical protein
VTHMPIWRWPWCPCLVSGLSGNIPLDRESVAGQRTLLRQRPLPAPGRGLGRGLSNTITTSLINKVARMCADVAAEIPPGQPARLRRIAAVFRFVYFVYGCFMIGMLVAA